MNDTCAAEGRAAWKPPFCATETELDCPKCGAKESVYVREHENYYDMSDYEAFCDECHADLVVYAAVDIAFHDAEEAPTFDDDALPSNTDARSEE